MIRFSKLTQTAQQYNLYVTTEYCCMQMVNVIDRAVGLIGKYAVCTSVDSGSYGFPELGERIGEYTGFVITAEHLKDWPTYSGFYDEWYVFDSPKPIIGDVDSLCNWACDYSHYEELYDCAPRHCRMNDYLDTNCPIVIFGYGENDGYIFSTAHIPTV